MYRAYTSYLLFVNKVWPFSVKMLFWTSVSLCTRAAIQLRNDAFCLNWAHTEVLNLISSGKFNDICLLSYINWLNWFFLNLSLVLIEAWPYQVVFSWTFLFLLSFADLVVWSKLQCASKRKPCPTDYLVIYKLLFNLLAKSCNEWYLCL